MNAILSKLFSRFWEARIRVLSYLFLCLGSCNALLAVPVTYGSQIQLTFPSLGLYLNSSQYFYQDGNAQRIVSGGASSSTLGVITVTPKVISNGVTATSPQNGQQVKNGDVIQLVFESFAGANNSEPMALHCHQEIVTFAPGSSNSLLEVTSGKNPSAPSCYNTGNNWIVKTENGQPWDTTVPVTFQPQQGPSSSYYLTMVGTQFNIAPSGSTANMQNIVGLSKAAPASWQAVMFPSSAAMPVVAASGAAAQIATSVTAPALTDPIVYGDTIQLSFPSIPGVGLFSTKEHYSHKTSSGQQQIMATPFQATDPNFSWVIMGPNGTSNTYQAGQQVKNGSSIRLFHAATKVYLHNHESQAHQSPDSTMLEVTGLGSGNTGNDWVISTSDGNDWTGSSLVTIKPATQLSDYYLTAKAETFPELSGNNVVGLNMTPKVYWQVVCAPAPVIPAGVQEEVGSTNNVAVGIRNNALEAWCITTNGSLARYNANDTSEGNPWVTMPAKDENGKSLALPLEMVSVSSDGIMIVLDANQQAHQYNWNKAIFEKIEHGAGGKLECIAAGNADNIWAVNAADQILKHDPVKGWEVVSGVSGIFVAAGSDGTVMVIDNNGNVWNYNGASASPLWTMISGQTLDRVAIGSIDYVFGIDNGTLYQFTGNAFVAQNSPAGTPSLGLTNVGVDSSGDMFFTDNAGNVYENLSTGAVIAASAPAGSAPAAAVGTVAARKKARKRAGKKAASKIAQNSPRAQAKKDKKINIKNAKKNVAKHLGKVKVKAKKVTRKPSNKHVGKAAGKKRAKKAAAAA